MYCCSYSWILSCTLIYSYRCCFNVTFYMLLKWTGKGNGGLAQEHLCKRKGTMRLNMKKAWREKHGIFCYCKRSIVIERKCIWSRKPLVCTPSLLNKKNDSTSSLYTFFLINQSINKKQFSIYLKSQFRIMSGLGTWNSIYNFILPINMK